MSAFKYFTVATLFIFTSVLTMASPLEDAEKLLLENKFKEAQPLLEQALLREPDNEKIYLYLGRVYEHFGKYDKAFQTFSKGLGVSRDKKHYFYLDMGISLYMENKITLAEEMYTKAINYDMSFEAPYLNRANARVALKKYPDAVDDYKYYLLLKPETPQRSEIQRMIDLLSGYIAAEEQKIEDAKQREQNLKDLLDTLEKSNSGNKNLSAGSETITSDYENEDIMD
ncbi:MAG: tetratricopeptide repeat protein [Spirochaetales bacterium]|nr:tetratricopeptide repeat protein [Spirochaetales bacterium]